MYTLACINHNGCVIDIDIDCLQIFFFGMLLLLGIKY